MKPSTKKNICTALQLAIVGPIITASIIVVFAGLLAGQDYQAETIGGVVQQWNTDLFPFILVCFPIGAAIIVFLERWKRGPANSGGQQ